jgi:hypothetical protein
MYKPSIYLVITYFLTYIPIYETYSLEFFLYTIMIYKRSMVGTIAGDTKREG